MHKSKYLLFMGIISSLILSGCNLQSLVNDPKYISIYIGEPRNKLVPGNTTESEGNSIIRALFSPLVNVNKLGNVVYDAVAKEISTKDSLHWIIKLKPGWTFHDGSPVTSMSYINAWNYTALGENAQTAASFFANILGYDAMQSTDNHPAKARKLSGVKYIDDLTFSVTLRTKQFSFLSELSYVAYYPLPKVFFDNPNKFGDKPIGNGPFAAVTNFVPGSGIMLKRYEKYSGLHKPRISGLEFRVYTSLDTAYLDYKAGILDILREIPDSALTTYQKDSNNRFKSYTLSSRQGLGFPLYDSRFTDKRVRQAFSMAINREEIVEKILPGMAGPLHSFVPPSIKGWREYACKYCVFNPAAARALLKTTEFNTRIPITYWYNSGAGVDNWILAVANQIKQNLHIPFIIKGNLPFNLYLPKLAEKGVNGLFRSSWIADYLAFDNFITPLFSVAALPPSGANFVFYINPKMDQLTDTALGSTTLSEYIKNFQNIEAILVEDMPMIPIFYNKNLVVWSSRVKQVDISSQANIDYIRLEPNKKMI